VKSLRHVFLVLFFAALAAIEITHGLYRLNTLHERHRERIIESVEREHAELARLLRQRLEGQREHAAFLATMPLVRAVASARGTDPAIRKQLESHLLPFLLAFRGIDRIRVLTPDGIELVRCERIGKGGRWASALPPPRLSKTPDRAIVELAQGLEPAQVARTTLLVDEQRVEVPASERQVIHYATGIREHGETTGILVLTVYASPILRQVRRFAPLAGTESCLVDADGSYLAHASRELERGDANPGNVLRDFRTSAPLLEASSASTPVDGGTLYAARISEAPSWSFLTHLPDDVVESASGHLSGEHAWVIGSVSVVTLALLVAAIFFVRLSIRELKLQEARRQKELERQLEISERLGSLGLVTAGVAHEINNPLEGIGNYLALLEKASLPTEKRMRYLRLLREGFHRIRDIVRDLQDTARPAVSDGTAHLDEVVDQALKLAMYDKKFKNVRVERDGLDRRLSVEGDAGRLQQVVLNLLLNSGRALDGEGTVWICAGDGEASRDDSRWVKVRVEDDGPGIPPENLGKIFDPFFTTTGGTGLGLAISFSIASAHGGTLTATNRPEGGACFTMCLPVARADRPSAALPGRDAAESDSDRQSSEPKRG
jgi:signal transduction histidine kinase